jgi:hypothetical protein
MDTNTTDLEHYIAEMKKIIEHQNVTIVKCIEQIEELQLLLKESQEREDYLLKRLTTGEDYHAN